MYIPKLQRIFIIVAVLVFCISDGVFAGGAVKKRKEMKKRQMRAQAGVRKKAEMQIKAKAKAIAEAKAKAAAQTKVQVQGHTQLQRLSVDHIRVNPKININKQSLPGNIAYETTITEINGDQLSEILSENSLVWLQIIDQPVKERVVRQYIDWYRKRNIRIQRTPRKYATLIDEVSQNNITLLQQPFERVLKIIAIMEYDFNNGQDKDALARQLFDTQGYYDNKKRIGLIP